MVCTVLDRSPSQRRHEAASFRRGAARAPAVRRSLHAIRTGGGRHSKGQGTGPSANMPRNLVTGKEAHGVAAFVAANASGSSTP